MSVHVVGVVALVLIFVIGTLRPVNIGGLPFGGVKSSGVGREESVDELLSHTETKAVTVVLR